MSKIPAQRRDKPFKRLNPIQDGRGGQKDPLYQFFSCYKRGNSPKNFLTFSFNPFFHTGVKVCT